MLKYFITDSSFATAISFSLIVSVSNSWPLVDPLTKVDLLFHLRNTPHTLTINLICLTHLDLTFDLANRTTNKGGPRLALSLI
jgi:hypothetical protein